MGASLPSCRVRTWTAYAARSFRRDAGPDSGLEPAVARCGPGYVLEFEHLPTLWVIATGVDNTSYVLPDFGSSRTFQAYGSENRVP